MDFTHLHLALNHVPVFAAVFGFLILASGIFLRSFHVRNVGLSFLVLSALVAIPVYLTGESAEAVVENIQGTAEGLIDEHQAAAQLSLALAFVSGIFAIGALIPLCAAYARLRAFLILGALFVSVLTCASMAWTANLGGQIRHTEIGANKTTNKTGSTLKQEARDDDDR